MKTSITALDLTEVITKELITKYVALLACPDWYFSFSRKNCDTRDHYVKRNIY